MSNFVVFPEYKEAIQSITKYGMTYLNGGAGSGKSTFIKYIRKLVPNSLLLAPTGIAAVNIKGRTIHSFFKYPPSFLTESDIVRPKADTCQFLRHTNLVIIDEISMVSSNLLDAVDTSMQMAMNNSKPFGGIPVLVVGDLFQLSPIVGNEVSNVYYEFYDSEYFFDSHVVRSLIENDDFNMVTLKRVMRQNDETFIDVLNSIRTDTNSGQAIDMINKCCRYEDTVPDEYVQITPYNDLSDATNNRKLNALETPMKTYYGTVSGKFNAKNFPVDQTLKLKVGAQIMICKNLSREVANGTIGKVIELNDSVIKVHVYSTGTVINIERVTWDEFGLFRDVNGKYKNESVGSYTQFPIKLAWSMTIHKCVAKGSKISVDGGTKLIEDIEVGDYVYSGFNKRKVINKWHSGIKDAYKLSLKSGDSIVCSSDHKILAYRGLSNPKFVKLQDLTTDYKVATSLYNYDGDDSWYDAYDMDTLTKPKLTYEFGYVIGALLGDGCYTPTKKEYRISISKPNIDVLNMFGDLCKSIGLDNVKFRSSKNDSIINDVYVINKEFKLFLHDIGLHMTHAVDKHIHDNFLKSNREFRVGILSGLIDTDGHVKDKKFVFTSSSSKLLESFNTLLKSLSIVGYKDSTNLQIFVTGNNAIDMANTIKCVNKDRLSKIMMFKHDEYSRSNNDTVDFVKCGFKYKKVPTTRHMNLHNDNGYVSRDIFYSPVVDIQYIGCVDMYDIEVDVDHSFVCDNIIVHNCQGATIKNLYIDIGRGAFATGMTYVALSRATSLDYLVMSKPLDYDDVLVDQRVIDFYNKFDV